MTLPPDLDWIARAELAPEETVEYAAQPNAGRAVLRSFGVWAFAIPWTAFSLFWTFAAAGGLSGDWPSGIGWAFPLFGLPFVVIGLMMLASPLFAWRKARRSLCVVTDRRAILFEATGFRDIGVRSFTPEALRDVRRTERPDGSGDLLFTATDAPGTAPVGFLNVPDVRLAEAAVNVLAATAEDRDERLDAIADEEVAPRRRVR